jgi:hypothetical protein
MRMTFNKKRGKKPLAFYPNGKEEIFQTSKVNGYPLDLCPFRFVSLLYLQAELRKCGDC